MKIVLFIACLYISCSCICQDIKPFVADGDAKYFDFWEGTWYELKPDNSLDSTSYFKIKRGIQV